MRLVRYPTHQDFLPVAAGSLDWNCFFRLPVSPLGQRYYSAIGADDIAAHSFAMEHEGQAVAVVACTAGGGRLTCFGFPIEILSRPGLDKPIARRAAREIMGEIGRLSREHGLAAAELRTCPRNDPDGMVAAALIGAGAIPRLEFRAEVDLALSDDDLAADLRHGHRQQARWGEAHLSLTHIDARAPCPEQFDRIRVLHAEVAGRVTRPRESWLAMLDFIAQGRGEAILGSCGQALVAANVVLDAGDTAYYASGVYRRDHFDKPLAHHCLFKAILRAKQRGLAFFDIGAIALPGDAASAKEMAIGYFKRGFTSRLVSSICWRLPPRGNP